MIKASNLTIKRQGTLIIKDIDFCVKVSTVKRLLTMKQWFNIMDPKFNLHLNMDGVAEVWIVKKPTIDGIVSSIEAFDTAGNLVVYCFGERKPGKPELASWRKIISELETTK